MKNSRKKQGDECCPKFNPEQWDDKRIKFESKLFVRDRIKSFFHIPLNFGGVVGKNMKKIEKAGALNLSQLMLVDESSLWGADIYFAVDRVVPNTKMIKISGIFLTKVFEGPFKNIRQWIKEMEDYVEIEGEKAKKLFFFYTTCPKCAKKYGENYVVIFAKI